MKSSFLLPFSCIAASSFVTRTCGIVRPCRRRWRVLSQWSRVTGPPTEDSGDGYGRKSRESDEGVKNKDKGWRRKRREYDATATSDNVPLSLLVTHKTPRWCRRVSKRQSMQCCDSATPAASLPLASLPLHRYSPIFADRRSFNCNMSMMKQSILRWEIAIFVGNLIIDTFDWIKGDELKSISVRNRILTNTNFCKRKRENFFTYNTYVKLKKIFGKK